MLPGHYSSAFCVNHACFFFSFFIVSGKINIPGLHKHLLLFNHKMKTKQNHQLETSALWVPNSLRTFDSLKPIKKKIGGGVA